MDERAFPNKDDLPVDVSELGELQAVEQECPGVYYLAVKSEDSLVLLSLNCCRHDPNGGPAGTYIFRNS